MDPTLPPGDAPPEDIVMAPPEEEAVAQAQVEAEAAGEVAQVIPEQQHLMEVQQEQQQLQPEVAQAEEGALAAAGAAAAAAQPAVMHAMTPDGQTVPITFDPQTGQYVTASGEVVVLQMPGGAETPGAAAADPGGGQGDAVQQQQDPKDGQVQQAMEQGKAWSPIFLAIFIRFCFNDRNKGEHELPNKVTYVNYGQYVQFSACYLLY